jgi:hypothetical protein
MAMATFPSSAGWKCSEPSPIHTREPLISCPMPGTIGRSSSTTPISPMV